MLNIVREPRGMMWVIEDTEFDKPPKELSGMYTHKENAISAIDAFKRKINESAFKATKRTNKKVAAKKAEESTEEE